VAFAPQNNPEIAISVFVEHGGHGGSVAAPIAKRVIETYLNPPKPESEEEKQEKADQENQNPEDQKQEDQVLDEQQPENKEQLEQYGD